ncbi:MAG TPA: hypothetical protein VF868_06155 [Bacteroidia bacterium]
MKKIMLALLFTGCLLVSKAQMNYTSETDVFNIKTVSFYGFDYTRLRIVDENRIGQPLKKFLFNLNIFLGKQIPKKKMQAWLRKDTVQMDIAHSAVMNDAIVNGRIASMDPYIFPKDSLNSFISGYRLNTKEGIGYSIIFESFNKADKTVSAYLVFFDIATKKVIYHEYERSLNRNSYNYVNDWKPAALEAATHLFEKYRAKRKAYLKSIAPAK